MNRLVCDCLHLFEDKIRDSYIKNNGNVDKVINDTQATLACTRCKESGCSKVDISFPDFIQELKDKEGF